jgi:hypothetical protein
MAVSSRSASSTAGRVLGRCGTLNSSNPLLQQWCGGLKLRHIAHSQAYTYYAVLGRLLGISVVVITTCVGTQLFIGLEGNGPPGGVIIAGVLSLMAALTSAVQTFLRYPELAEQHKTASLAYGSLRRKVEEKLMQSSIQLDQPFLEELRRAWDEIDSFAPALPQSIHNRTLRRVRDDKKESANQGGI